MVEDKHALFAEAFFGQAYKDTDDFKKHHMRQFAKQLAYCMAYDLDAAKAYRVLRPKFPTISYNDLERNYPHAAKEWERIYGKG